MLFPNSVELRQAEEHNRKCLSLNQAREEHCEYQLAIFLSPS